MYLQSDEDTGISLKTELQKYLMEENCLYVQMFIKSVDYLMGIEMVRNTH